MPCSFTGRPSKTPERSLPLFSLAQIRGRAALPERVQPFLLFRCEVGCFQQVGTALPGTPDGHAPAPALDPPVVSRDQRLGHPPAAKHFRPRVLGMLEK